MKLGDFIYYITKYTGIKFIVEKYHTFMGSKCNCDKRRKDLNDLKIKRWQNLKKKIELIGENLGWETNSTYQLSNLNWFANSTRSTTSIHIINPVLVHQKP